MKLNPTEFSNVLHDLTGNGQLILPQLAKERVPNKFGLYSIFVDSTDALPPEFKKELRERETTLIYVGLAKKQTLKKRLISQDLSGQGHSTFFRSIGAVLGYRPERGSLVGKKNPYNFVFTKEDKKEIVDWIDTFIRVCWCITEPCVIDDCEKKLIQSLYPLLNLNHNPCKFEPLKKKREQCRNIARDSC